MSDEQIFLKLKPSRKHYVSINVDEEMYDRITNIVKLGVFPDRSEFIRNVLYHAKFYKINTRVYKSNTTNCTKSISVLLTEYWYKQTQDMRETKIFSSNMRNWIRSLLNFAEGENQTW